MSEAPDQTEGDTELRGRMPELLFERKLYLSILIDNSRWYLAKPATGQALVEFTTNRANAQLLALYRVKNEPADTFMMQAVPNDEGTVSTGGFLAFWGPRDFVPAMYVHMSDASRFIAMQNGNELRIKFAGNFVVAARGPENKIYFWIPGSSIWENATWLTETTVRWSANMSGQDLRNVEQLRNMTAGLISVANADLRRADFSGATLNICDFRGARFGDTRFVGSTLYSCQLGGVNTATTNFTNATLYNCELGGADLTGATFANTSFQASQLASAKLQNCNLSGCRFHDAKLGATDFTKATLVKTEFLRAQAQGVIMTEAAAQRADFTSATLTDARLDKAALAGAKFAKATLTRANLSWSTFGESESQRTDFREAKLYEIDFTACNLSMATLDQPALFQENTAAKPPEKRRALLCFATVPLAVLGNSSWRMLDLTGAQISAKPASFVRFNGDYCNFPNEFDLQGHDLSFASFRYARLQGAKLQNTKALGDEPDSGPDFSNADLRSAQFVHADLYKARFEGAQLNGAKLAYAILEFGNFKGARLESLALPNSVLMTDLSHANLINASFENAHIGRGATLGHGANFSSAIFYGDTAKLTNATMDGAQFSDAYLVGLDFTGGNAKAMDAMNFANACLANCKFKKAALTNAVLTGACLLGADFTDATLLGAQLGGANISLTPPAGKLKARLPNGTTEEIVPLATRIDTRATNAATSCPAGSGGPCAADSWTRPGGVVLRWPINTAT